MAQLTPTLSIAIVLYNSSDGLADTLRSIREPVESGFAEVIAVDNSSPDDSVDIVRSELPAAKHIALADNRGFAAGVNVAFANAGGDYWLMLNPDVQVPTGGLETLVAWMTRHRSVGVASPDLVGRDGEWQSPGRALPSVGRALLELSRLHRLLPADVRGRLLRGPYWTGGDQLDAGWVPGTAMIVRPAAAREVGPLREDLFMYGEDLEWCWRMRQAGWRIGVCSSTAFVHDEGASARASFGDVDMSRRIAAGVDAACREMYGPTRARILAAVSALALIAEAAVPARTARHRSAMRRSARIWWELARRR